MAAGAMRPSENADDEAAAIETSASGRTQPKPMAPIQNSRAYAPFRIARTASSCPSVELGVSVRADDGSLIYPFGSKAYARGSLRYSQLGSYFNPSKRWMVIEIDKTTPKEVDATLTNASWYGALPDKPVHGGAWLALMYDGSVTTLSPYDYRLNNTAAQ